MKGLFLILLLLLGIDAYAQDWENHTTALPENSTVIDFKVVSENEIYAIGEPFKFAKWDGINWTIINGMENLTLIDFSVYDSNNIFILARETNSSFLFHYKKWNGNSWESLPSPNSYQSTVYPVSIRAFSPNEVFISNYYNNINNGNTMTKWNGAQWDAYSGSSYKWVFSFLISPEFIYIEAKGASSPAGPPYNLAVMNHSGRSIFPLNFSNQTFNEVKNMTWLNPYEFYISESGYGQSYEYSANNHCWKWNSSFWVQLPNIDEELSLDKNQISSMHVHNQNELYVGGNIRSSVTGKYITGKWDGNNWSELSELNANTKSILDQNGGYLYAMGNFTVGADTNAAFIKRIDIGSNLGVAENGQEEEFRFYPNPAENLIKFNKTVDKVSLISMDGKIIKEANLINEMSIEDISSGVYFLNFDLDDSRTFVKKLIKK